MSRSSSRSVLSMFDLTPFEIERIFTIAQELKQKLQQGIRQPLLPGRVMAMLFEKPSLRTRVSFEAAMAHLGGGSMFLGQDVGFGQRESIADFGQVLSQYVDVIVFRGKSHRSLEQLAEHCTCAVINGLTDRSHPCQALADLFTLGELHGTLRGKKLAYIGDANNVARSLAVACGKLGVTFAIASPAGYEFDEQFLSKFQKQVPQAELLMTADPREAVRDALGVYTDVWTSMGQEDQHLERLHVFAEYQVNAKLMALAPSEACFLHCLPARRGEEVTDDVIDGAQSAVIQQASNRLHAQKGLLAWLLEANLPGSERAN